jgi:hypothetical protein
VISDIARQIVDRQADGEWRVTVTDPDTGAVLADGTTTRRPTAAQRRYLEARQTTCSNPRCRMPAHRSDIDHNHRRARGGRTEVDNLAPACRHDHMLLTVGGWTLQQPQAGVYVWTTRHGFRYTHRPRPP